MDCWALKKSQYWPYSQIAALRERKLRMLLQGASTLPFWKQYFEKGGIDPGRATVSELERIPVTDRRDFSDLQSAEYIIASLLPRSFADQTSGSTGSPFRFYHDRGIVLRSFAVRERMFRTAAKGMRYQIVSMRAKERIGMAFFKHYFFYIRGSNSIRHRLPHLVDVVNKLYREGIVLYAIASWVMTLAREVERAGVTIPFQAVISTGESMLPKERTYVEKALQTKLFLVYASQEGNCMAFECEHQRFHINEEEIYFQIVDSSGASLPYGAVGKVVFTLLDNRVMPFIRYSNGDIGSISDEQCPCGRRLRTITLLGREKDLIQLPEGREIVLMDLAPIFDYYFDAIQQYQIVQKSTKHFLIRVIVTAQFEAKQERLTARLMRVLHPAVRIDWEVVTHIPHSESGKAIYFVRESIE